MHRCPFSLSLSIYLEVAQTVRRVRREELGDNVHGTAVDCLGEVQVAGGLDDALENLLLVVVLERRVAH